MREPSRRYNFEQIMEHQWIVEHITEKENDSSAGGDNTGKNCSEMEI